MVASEKILGGGGASAVKVPTVHGVKEFQRTTSIVLAEKTKKE